VKGVEMRNGSAARSTPGCPEFHHRHVALQVAQVDAVLVVENLAHFQRGHWIVHLQVGPGGRDARKGNDKTQEAGQAVAHGKSPLSQSTGKTEDEPDERWNAGDGASVPGEGTPFTGAPGPRRYVPTLFISCTTTGGVVKPFFREAGTDG